MRLEDICGVQESDSGRIIYIRAMMGEKPSSVSFSVMKTDVLKAHLSYDEAFKEVLGRIIEECDSISDVEQAKIDISRDTRRGTGSVIDNLVLYRGRNASDSGILVLQSGDLYCPCYPDGWKGYYRIIKGVD